MKTAIRGFAILALAATSVQTANAQSYCGDVVVVSQGDTLGEIASRCGTSVGEILNANPFIDNPNRIYSGLRLNIPYYSDSTTTYVSEPLYISTREVDDLVGPIALYPDVLLAQILPAATYPLEVSEAANWRRTHNPSQARSDYWAPSVMALLHYPDVLYMLADDIAWTSRLGDVFLDDPDAVSNSIQRLRTTARGYGYLQSNQQQVVIVERNIIRIDPFDPWRVYVPRYDPRWVFFGGRYDRRYALNWGVGFGLGSWIIYDFDWNSHRVYRHRRDNDRFDGWRRDRRRSDTRWEHDSRHRRDYRYTGRARDRYDSRRDRRDSDRNRVRPTEQPRLRGESDRNRARPTEQPRRRQSAVPEQRARQRAEESAQRRRTEQRQSPSRTYSKPAPRNRDEVNSNTRRRQAAPTTSLRREPPPVNSSARTSREQRTTSTQRNSSGAATQNRRETRAVRPRVTPVPAPAQRQSLEVTPRRSRDAAPRSDRNNRRQGVRQPQSKAVKVYSQQNKKSNGRRDSRSQ